MRFSKRFLAIFLVMIIATVGMVSLVGCSNNYSIKYVLNGGVNHPDNPFEYTSGQEVKLERPTKEYHLFLGWYETADFSSNKIEKIGADAKGDKTLYANWKGEFSITYELNGGTNHADNPTSYAPNQTIELKNPTKEGYDFLGWKDSENSTTYVTKVGNGEMEDKVLYAIWKESATNPPQAKAEYTVTFATSYKDINYTVKGNATQTVKEDSNIEAVTVEVAGLYAFDKWVYLVGEQEKEVSINKIVNAENFPDVENYTITLYATFTPITEANIEYIQEEITIEGTRITYSIKEGGISKINVGENFVGLTTVQNITDDFEFLCWKYKDSEGNKHNVTSNTVFNAAFKGVEVKNGVATIKLYPKIVESDGIWVGPY